MTRSMLLFAAVASLAGCLPTTPGELQNGGFTYFCAGDSDLACRSGLLGASGVPGAIAVNAHFDLEYSPPVFHEAGQPTVTSLDPASPAILKREASQSVDADGFRFTAPGTVAILARGSGMVVDFIHVTGASIDHVAVIDDVGDETTAIELSSWSKTLRALPRSGVDTLAGSLSYTWESSDESVVSVTPGYEPNEVEIGAGNPGQATVTVTVLDQKTSVEVTVGGGK